MTRQFINPPGMKALGTYTQVTVARGGGIGFISGQVAVDGEGKVVGAGDVGAQAVQVFENLKLALQSIGASFADVVKFTIYIVGLTQERRKAVADVRSRYVSAEHPPAATMVGIEQLVLPELLVEVEAVVALD
jgi:enamine deaminase RidA (YjgF/YER057c/UK114 family)